MVLIKAKNNTDEIITKFGPLEEKKFLCLLDLELTCEEGRGLAKDEMEIIEIGIATVELNGYTINKQISEFVCPANNPILTKFCKDLTGIKQSEIDKAKPLPEVFSNIIKELPDPRDFVFVSWGGDSQWLSQELTKKAPGREDLAFDPRFINLKLSYQDRYGKRGGLKKILKDEMLPQIEPAHRALSDALSLHLLAKKLQVTGIDCMVSNSKSYRQRLKSMQAQTIEKLVKRTGIEEYKAERILKIVQWDVGKAIQIFKIFN
jgi:inhibitor of KinA sporulation pathway (predicted exonuclease)